MSSRRAVTARGKRKGRQSSNGKGGGDPCCASPWLREQTLAMSWHFTCNPFSAVKHSTELRLIFGGVMCRGGGTDGKAPGAASGGEHRYMESCDLLKHVSFLALFIWIWSLETTHSGTIYDNSLNLYRVFSLFFIRKSLGISHSLITGSVLVSGFCNSFTTKRKKPFFCSFLLCCIN